MSYRLVHGDCRLVLPTLANGSVDAVICDPPYPCIKRSYGEWTEAEWRDLMHVVVGECRRVLKMSGSAVFVLQPNNREAGSVRPWLYDFQSWACRAWNVVQDAYSWNYAALPVGGTHRGLMRPSVTVCVWLGDPDCYRDQEAVLWDEAESGPLMRRVRRARLSCHAPGHHRVSRVHRSRIAAKAAERGGVTPFNLIPVQGGDRWEGGGILGHTAATSRDLCDYWVRYICPPGGVVLDPFCGSATVGLAALSLGRSFIGIESYEPYIEMARSRLDGSPLPLFDGPPSREPDALPLFAGAESCDV